MLTLGGSQPGPHREVRAQSAPGGRWTRASSPTFCSEEPFPGLIAPIPAFLGTEASRPPPVLCGRAWAAGRSGLVTRATASWRRCGRREDGGAQTARARRAPAASHAPSHPAPPALPTGLGPRHLPRTQSPAEDHPAEAKPSQGPGLSLPPRPPHAPSVPAGSLCAAAAPPPPQGACARLLAAPLPELSGRRRAGWRDTGFPKETPGARAGGAAGVRPGAPELTRGLPSAPRSAPGSGSGPRSQTQAPGSCRAWGPKGPGNLPPCSPHRRTPAFVISLRPVPGAPDSPVSPCSGSGFLAAHRGRGCFPASPERRAVSLGCTGWGGPGAGDSHPPRGLRPGRGGRTAAQWGPGETRAPNGLCRGGKLRPETALAPIPDENRCTKATQGSPRSQRLSLNPPG